MADKLKFIVDECTGPLVAKWLSARGYDTWSVFDQQRGMADLEVLKKAKADGRVLITNDRDFGEMIFKKELSHCGVIHLRLRNERSKNKIAVIEELLKFQSNSLKDNYVVVREASVRIIRR